MKRREFLKAALTVAIGAPCLWVMERVAPARYTEALRARFYPGAIKKTPPDHISRTARWAG